MTLKSGFILNVNLLKTEALVHVCSHERQIIVDLNLRIRNEAKIFSMDKQIRFLTSVTINEFQSV